jgi:gamma-glutamyl-gamma-aminobutyrate hydrolase PuuD
MTPPVVLVTTTSDTSRVWVDSTYTDALVAGGLTPVVLPPISPTAAVAALDHVSGLVLTGGEDIAARHFGETPHPASGAPHLMRDEYEIALSRAARDRGMPTLAICRGAQVLNVALGGSVIQDISRDHPRGSGRVHDVHMERSSRLSSIFGDTRITVNGYHHQAIARVADGIRVAGTSADGIIEAIEAEDESWWMMGVQWHAEELTQTPEPWDRRLFDAFGDAVRGWSAQVPFAKASAQFGRPTDRARRATASQS